MADFWAGRYWNGKFFNSRYFSGGVESLFATITANATVHATLTAPASITALSGSRRRYVRGRVGRLDEEFRKQLVAEQQERIAAQVRAMASTPEPGVDYAKLADLQASLAMQRATMATIEFLQRRAAYQERAEREASEMQAAIMAYAEAIRIAEERDEEDAIEAFLLAA